jgi:hypothetical protein
MSQITLDAIAEAFGTWLRTADALVVLAAQVAPADRKEAVARTSALLADARASLASWKGPSHVD